MASISGNGSKGHHKFTLTVTENSTSTANNTSSVGFSFTISPIQTSWNWEQWGSSISYTVTVNGTKYTGTIPNYDGYSTVTLKSGTLSVGHNDDGKKTISFSFSVTDSTGQSYTCGNASGSGSMALTTIPRYLSITTFDITSITETSVVVKWVVSDPRTSTYYSFDNGATWTGSATYGESLASDGKSGTFNIQGLSANTAYKLKIKIKRTDSDLWTESGQKSFTTYNYPYCNSAPNFTIGNAVKIGFYNPLGRSLKWTIIGANSGIIAENSTTATSYTGINGEGSVANLYKSIPNAKSGTYRVLVVYGNNTSLITGGTYSITGKEVPTVGTISYADTDTSVTNITGNNQHIVQNKSNLKVTYGVATAKNSATISKYTFELNGVTKTSTTAGGTVDFGKVNSANNLTLTCTVTDSRGLTASTKKTITMLAYSAPTALVTLERLNNYEDESYLTVDGSVASVNGKNTMTIRYRYRVLGGSYNSYASIADNTKRKLTLDKNNVYIFNVFIVDAFGSTYDAEHTLGKGVFPLFIDTGKNSVGVNCFPNNDNSFEVDGLVSASVLKCKNLLYTPYTESNKLTITATKDDNAIVTGYYCFLEADKKYTFSCKTDGAWGGTGGTDTVEVFLLKDKAYTSYVSITSNPKTITVSLTGNYFLRVDVNKSGTTHSFWDIQIEEGGVATDFVEAKQFEYQEQYYLGEHKVGYWFNGKPLYRQIISLGSSHFGTTESTEGKSISVAHNISNISDVIKTEDVWCTNGQYRRFPFNYYGSAGWDGQYFTTKTNIQFELGSAIYNRLVTATTFLYIIIYYTKTTD